MAGSQAISRSDLSARGAAVRDAKQLVSGNRAVVRTMDDAIERISELEECVTQLLGHLTGRAQIGLPPNFGFTPHQEVMLTMLLTRPIVSRDQFMAGVYPFDDDAPGDKIIDVQICKMRPRLDELGVEIVTSWGRGWMFSAEHKARLRDIIVFFGGTVDGD